MGWSNPPIPWSEFERALSEGRRPGSPPVGADGGDSPAWSRKRTAYRAPRGIERPEHVVPYAELHAHSSFSFLDGASMPEELLEEAARLGLAGLALTDHDGLYGAVRLAEAAEAMGVPTIFGAELSLGLPSPQNGVADPAGSHLLVLARGQEGYHRLAGAITAAQLAGGEKGRPVYDLDDLAERAEGRWLVLTGCRKGAVRRALAAARSPERGGAAAGEELDRLVARFGRENVAVELFDHGAPLDSRVNDVLAALAAERGLPVVATGVVHYATPAQHPLATALAAVRARRSLDELDGWLPASGGAFLRSGAEMAERFARYPGAVARTAELAAELAFPLRRARPRLPRQEVPEGHTPMSWLRHRVWEGARERYGERLGEAHRARIEDELEVIEQKDFPGYFLIVHDIVSYARRNGILCQGRGSAANSAVCYVLGITAVDAIRYDLPFSRFLSALRDEEPDIDVDFDADRREEVIQYVYKKYGRNNAAQVANVITYRPKNAVRDMARALGHSPGQQDAWAKQVERWGALVESADHDIPPEVVGLAAHVLKFPRHLGIHSGGMVLTDRPVGEVVPIEHARMERRTVLQWEKDDCAWMGLVKFDLLGLGMLAALQYAFDLMHAATGERWDLATIPAEEPAVYDMLCRADAIGIFQVESRAQLGLLPRLRPRQYYDLAIQIALVRPGPIQGGAVHPFVRRKAGLDPIVYPHESLVPVLERTLGVPIFQEQLMQMAMTVGDCSGDDADLLRRAMGSKRGLERIESLREKLYAGMARHGITGELADELYGRIQAFASFGFAESHSLSFALLVYASAWIKLHYPAVFLAALLRAQPMGFYSPATLVADAERHGVEVRRPCIQRSGAHAGLEREDGERAGGARGGEGGMPGGAGGMPGGASGASGGTDGRPGAPVPPPLLAAATGIDSCLVSHDPAETPFDPDGPDESGAHRRDAGIAVRLGLAAVKGIGAAVAERIVAAREAAGPFRDLPDLVRRTGLTVAQLEALATAGAFDALGLGRREALWAAGNAAQDRPEFLPHSFVAVQPPLFALPTERELLYSDLWATGVSPGDHPLRHVRAELDARGVLPAEALRTAEAGRRIEVGGVVTHRQRPATASGITFLNIEDETGLVNVICSAGMWSRYRRIVRDSPALVVRGMLERSPEGVTNVLADAAEPLTIPVGTRSRDFR